MKIKIFVGIALVIFVLTVGSILAFGLLQKNSNINANINTGTVQTPDVNAVVDTKKNIQQSAVSAALSVLNSSSANDTSTSSGNIQAAPSNTNTQINIQPPVQQPAQQPVQQPAQVAQNTQPQQVAPPVIIRRTRAS
jgi:hypothetical protein